MEHLQIGQIIQLTEERNLEGWAGTKRCYKPGTQMQVTSGGSIVYPDGAIEMLSKEDFIVKDYDTEGIAKRILKFLKRDLPFDDMMENYDVTDKEVIEAIEDALYDIF